MQTRMGLGLGLGMTRGGGGGVAYDFYVDSVGGSNSNDGLTPATAKQTIAAVQTLANSFGTGARVGLARGSYWREQYTVSINSLAIGIYGTGDMPVLDGADIITGTWTQPDAVTNPNVWSISWSRSEAASTGSAHMGYWEDGVRTTRYTTLALLQAGVNGGWHTTSLTGTTVTLSIRAAANPNTDGILREATKRGHGIDSHTQTTAGTWTGLNFTGPIEMKRSVEHYNALSMGQGEASQFLLRDGNIHHSVSEGNQTDILAIEAAASVAPSVWAFYRATSSGFNPVGTRLLSLLPGGASRQDGASAFYAHGGSGQIASFTLNGCISRGCDFMNADAVAATVSGGYCEDPIYRPISYGASTNTISHFLARETSGSPFSSSNCVFFTGGASAVNVTVTHSAGHLLRTGARGIFDSNTTIKHYYSNCAFVVPAQVVSGGRPDLRYCVFQGARTYDNINSAYTGDFNVFYFVTIDNPQFNYNGTTYSTLATFQAASGQDANSVFLKHSDQVSGNGIAFWLGLANGENLGPRDGDWRINPSARVYNGAGTALTGLFADGVTPITEAGPQEYWNFNTRAVTAGVPVVPTLPTNLAEYRAYVEDPAAWDFYP